MSCINPSTNLPYQIEDVGPGGGIIFSIPGQGLNNTNYYFEVALHDVSTTQRSSAISGGATPYDCGDPQNQIPGAEFGVYKETILPGDNGYLVGDGVANTTHLNSYPTSWGGYTGSPTNPVIDTHTLAAMECANYVGPNGHTDWFLPSLNEASELMLNLGPPSPIGNVANLNTSNSNPASAFYWTSSVIALPNYEHLALGFNTTGTGGPQIMDRCTTGSVRPVRRFECIPTVPCTGCSCVDYNWVDASYPVWGSLVSGGSGANIPPSLQPLVQNGIADSVMGADNCAIWLSGEDVMGNAYGRTGSLWDDSIGYTITMWSHDYVFLGKWHYSTFVPSTAPPFTDGTICNGLPVWCSCEPQPYGHALNLTGVTHLQGPNPVINYNNPNTQVAFGPGSYGSVTHTFWKIECAATVGNSTANGCDSFNVHGNLPYLPDTQTTTVPWQCRTRGGVSTQPGAPASTPPLVPLPACWSGCNPVCLPTYQVHQGMPNVYSSAVNCATPGASPWNCCGVSLTGGGSSKLADSGGSSKLADNGKLLKNHFSNIGELLASHRDSSRLDLGTLISCKTSYVEDDNQDVEVRINKNIQTKKEN